MSSETLKPRPDRLRITFSIGSEEDGRWITFGDDVELCTIAEWFRFTGEAITRMFNTGRAPVRVDLVTGNLAQKISSIKIVRQYTGCGLKEAKDAIEMAYSGLIGVFEDHKVADAFIAELNGVGCLTKLSPAQPDSFMRMKAQGTDFLYVEMGRDGIL